MKVASIHIAPGSRHRQVTIQSREALDQAVDQLGYLFDTIRVGDPVERMTRKDDGS